MNFKSWLLSEEIYPQNKTATVFHRTCAGCDVDQSTDSVAGILTSDFKAGARKGCWYGCGLYTTFALESQFVGGMQGYGHAVIKFKVTGLDNYLIFQTSVAKAIHGKDYKLSDQLKKFGVLNKVSPNTNLPEIEQQLLTRPFSGDTAKKFYDKNRWMEKSLKGIILRGHNDGFVLVKYEPVQDGTITMLGYAVAKDNDFEKMKNLQVNDGWIKSTDVAAMKSIYNLPQEKRSQYKFTSNPFLDKLLKADPKTYEFLVKKYKTEIKNLIDKSVSKLLQDAADKDKIDKIAELIIQKKPKLSYDDVINLLFYAKDQNKITTLLGKKKIAKLFADIEHLLEDANYISDSHSRKIAQVYARYKSKISDYDVHILLKYGGDEIIKSIMAKRPDLSYDYLRNKENDIHSP